MDLDLEILTQEFLRESEEGLTAMEEALLVLEAHPEDPESLSTVFRVAHTMKGNAMVVNFQGVVQLAHVLEDLLEGLRERELPVTTRLVTTMLEAVDLLRRLIPEAAAGNETASERERKAFEGRLRSFLGSKKGSAPAAAPSAGDSSDEGALANSAAYRTASLRVDVEKLDRMLNLSGEIAIARGRLTEMLEHADRCSWEQILEAHRLADRSYVELQEQVIKVRMVPVGPILRQLNRTIRDLAVSQGKQARLVIEGADVEVDMTVMEHLRDPLAHMLRNAVDHGLESPEKRAAEGKDATGTVTVRAWHEAGSIVIRLTDDGSGLDRRKIAEVARRRGISVERLSDAELLRLILEPGFSTAETVTNVSGRGVGMDVVRGNIEALHGSISVESAEGRGTAITLRLPLTLALIQGFAVSVSDETYVIPLDAVLECLELPRTETKMTDAREGYINLRGEPLPYLRLRSVFALEGARPAREGIVVVRHDGKPAGLVVDGFLGESQTVIKPLGRVFRDVPGISGGAILGTGRVALILDLAGLFQDVLSGARDPASEVEGAPQLPAAGSDGGIET